MAKILVVEDNWDVIGYYEEYLANKGEHELLIAETAEKAIDLLSKNFDINIAIMDNELKYGTYSWPVTDYIRDVVWPTQAEDKKLIFVTASTNPYEVEGATKVFTKHDLIRNLREAFFQGTSSWINEILAEHGINKPGRPAPATGASPDLKGKPEA